MPSTPMAPKQSSRKKVSTNRCFDPKWETAFQPDEETKKHLWMPSDEVIYMMMRDSFKRVVDEEDMYKPPEMKFEEILPFPHDDIEPPPAPSPEHEMLEMPDFVFSDGYDVQPAFYF